jgi:hypothetical protein
VANHPSLVAKKKGIVLICLTLCLQIPSNEPQQKNLLSANQFFSLIDMVQTHNLSGNRQ